jgi:hypothetical protein
MKITVTQKGSTKNTMSLLKRILSRSYLQSLEHYGQLGVEALSSATPVRTGATADAWRYKIEVDNKATKIVWTNSNTVDGCNVALLIQYGHGTRNGGYVQGIDFINPAIRPIFTGFADNIWREVMRK